MSLQPRLRSLDTAVPPYLLDQKDVRRHAAALFGDRDDISRLLTIFENAGIRRRYSCVPIDWYAQPHGWTDRTEVYVRSAVDLLEEVALSCLRMANLSREALDAIVVASTTGIATPSLDALLVERLRLRRDIRRLPIFGLGCAGGVTGLSRAADLANAHPGSNVLFLVVELCAHTFRRNDLDKSNLVATALFGDGAAGAIVSTAGEGPRLTVSGEYTWPDSLGIMGWDVREDGLKARFARDIPALVRNDLAEITSGFLARHDLALRDIDRFACHPGGAKVLDALEAAFGLGPGALVESREVLRDFGNMSAATVMFVLARMNWRESAKRTLLSALGPGFSATFLVLDGT
ncbi:MAG TPA: 3-oxoacyl-[acyl-carrier-protein] synthase III C-terminal domain-containing protein [Rhizomicrobium sp.]|jgi:alkylresorcinol/alkylpyrone synthase